MDTQIKTIKNHLIYYKSITSIEAIKLYGVTRLASIIFDLREHYKIETELIEVKNRLGGYSKIGKYHLKGQIKKRKK